MKLHLQLGMLVQIPQRGLNMWWEIYKKEWTLALEDVGFTAREIEYLFKKGRKWIEYFYEVALWSKEI